MIRVTLIPTLADIEAARERIRGITLRTPLVRLNVSDGPGEIYLKLESLQPIGSFKIRGAANAMGRLAPEELAQGVLTASAGNMAQGVAWCARARGIPCTVVAPDTAPATKIAAIERLGGRVIKVPFERWWETFETRRFPGVEGTFIHAFDDPPSVMRPWLSTSHASRAPCSRAACFASTFGNNETDLMSTRFQRMSGTVTTAIPSAATSSRDF
jgi:threonine dehydratase